MACRTPIVASYLPAFSSLLDGGASCSLFKNEDSSSLARNIIELLGDEATRQKFAVAGYENAGSFDWGVVGQSILSVYEMVITGNSKVTLASENRFWNRLRSNG